MNIAAKKYVQRRLMRSRASLSKGLGQTSNESRDADIKALLRLDRKAWCGSIGQLNKRLRRMTVINKDGEAERGDRKVQRIVVAEFDRDVCYHSTL